MADTIRTQATLLTQLADNTSHAITPQVLRDFLISVHGVYGEISVEDGSTAQTFNTTPAIMTCWNTAAGANGVSAGTTPDKANNQITVGTAGIYIVRFNMAIINGNTGTTYKFYIRVNGNEQRGGTYVKTSSNDVVSVGTTRVLSLAASDIVTVYGESDTDSKAATPTDGVLIVNRIA